MFADLIHGLYCPKKGCENKIQVCGKYAKMLPGTTRFVKSAKKLSIVSFNKRRANSYEELVLLIVQQIIAALFRTDVKFLEVD